MSFELRIPADEREAVRRLVAPFASRDEARPILTYVHLRVRNRRREWTATDSYRLARWRSPHPAEALPVPALLAPAKALRSRDRVVDGVTTEAQMSRPDWQVRYPRIDPLLAEARARQTVTALPVDPSLLAVPLKACEEIIKAEKVRYGGNVRVLLGGAALRIEDPGTPAEVFEHLQFRFDLDSAVGHVWCHLNPTYLRQFVQAGTHKAADGPLALHMPLDGMSAVRFTAGRWEALLMPVRP